LSVGDDIVESKILAETSIYERAPFSLPQVKAQVAVVLIASTGPQRGVAVDAQSAVFFGDDVKP
jgi:hypothetical protein